MYIISGAVGGTGWFISGKVVSDASDKDYTALYGVALEMFRSDLRDRTGGFIPSSKLGRELSSLISSGEVKLKDGWVYLADK